jgi:hypothetical protein
MDYKRCPKKWYWKWRRGLTLKRRSFGALDLGTWVHEALAAWYSITSLRGKESIQQIFGDVSNGWIDQAAATGAPDYELERAEELAALGAEMLGAYQEHYHENDPEVYYSTAEVPLEFDITDENEELIARYKLKPDLLYKRRGESGWRLMEHKTAASIRTEHLSIDGQARPYGVLTEQACIKAGIFTKQDKLIGITYNYLRKALPDIRPKNEKGQALNKNGSVSKTQPSPLFLRKEVTLTREAKRVTLRRIRTDAVIITQLAEGIRKREIDPELIPKTPHHSCPKTCDYFGMCEVEEAGGDYRTMEKTMYTIQDPYTYDEETTDDAVGFEMG